MTAPYLKDTKSGWLWLEQKPKMLRKKTGFKNYHFVLRHDQLSYFKRPFDSATCMGVIPIKMKNIQIISEPPKSIPTAYAFEISIIDDAVEDLPPTPRSRSSSSASNDKTDRRKRITLCALTEDDQLDWIRVLAQASAFYAADQEQIQVARTRSNTTTSLPSIPSLSSSLSSSDGGAAAFAFRPLPPAPSTASKAVQDAMKNDQARRNLEMQMRVGASSLITSWFRMHTKRRHFHFMRCATTAIQVFVRHARTRVRFNKIKKQNAYRKRVIDEMLQTEKSYYEGLNALVMCFQKPLMEMLEPKKGVSPSARRPRQRAIVTIEQIQTIFSNAESILGLHEFLISALRPRIDDWHPNQTFADIFVAMSAQFKLYTQYINNFDNAMKLLEAFSNNTKDRTGAKFIAFCTSVSNTLQPPYQGQFINSFMILPVQRLPRYEMLLRDIFKNTWPDHPDWKNLDSAIKVINGITTFLNESKRNNENMNRLGQINKKMAGQSLTDLNLLQPHRKMVREGALNQLILGDGSAKKKGRYVFLFSDIILCSNSLKVRKLNLHCTVNFDYKWMIPLENANLSAELDELTFRVVSEDGKVDVTFAAETEQERTSWIADIRKCIESAQPSLPSPA